MVEPEEVGGHDLTQILRPRTGAALRGGAVLCLALLSATARADDDYCFDQAARTWGVDGDVLRAIAWRESRFMPWKVRTNRDGSTDYGLMQINSRNLPSLGLDSDAVMDPCQNILAGAQLYRRQVDRWGNTWDAVGAYHSTTPALRQRYATEVRRDWAVIHWLRSQWTRLRGLFGG